MRNHTCLLDHHPKSRYVTIGLKERVRFYWVLKIDSHKKEVARQPQEEVARQAKFSQPTQPIPKPICDRSGQPDITQDVISVQTCPSEENKNVRVEQTHSRSGQPDKDTTMQYKTTLKCIMRAKRSTLTMRQFVKELRKTWTSQFQDYQILL